MIDKDYLLERITEEQILAMMKSFGSIPHTIKEKEIWFRTICHNGNSHKLCYFRETKTFYCYTNCGAMSLYNLVMNVKQVEFYEAIKIVANAAGLNSRHGFQIAAPKFDPSSAKLNLYFKLRNTDYVKKELTHLPAIEDTILNYFENDIFYSGWIKEGISPETMETFNIRWYEYEKHIIIPHYNMYGQLVGIRRRSLQEKDKNNKYMPEIIENVSYAHPLGLNLYGLDRHLKGIQKTKRVIIVESEKSVMLGHEYYGEDAYVVATCGFTVSNWQRDILLNLGVEEVIIAFDKDFDLVPFEDCAEDDPEYKKFLRYVDRLYSVADKFVAYCRTFVLWDEQGLLDVKDSPFDKGKEILEQLMLSKVEITTDLRN